MVNKIRWPRAGFTSGILGGAPTHRGNRMFGSASLHHKNDRLSRAPMPCENDTMLCRIVDVDRPTGQRLNVQVHGNSTSLP